MRPLKIILFAALFIPAVQAKYSPQVQSFLDPHSHTRPRPAYYDLAQGSIDKALPKIHPWPFKLLSIGHTMASYQNYSAGLSGAYFHHGLDIRGPAGETVEASAGGKVVNIENYMPGPSYWEVAILDDEGYIWQYHHIHPNSIPQEIKNAFKNRTKVPAGTKVGTIIPWSVSTFGETYHHVHLNVLGKDGVYLNPFAFLTPLADEQAPQILRVGILKDGVPNTQTRVQGKYSLFVEATDLILHNKFVVPPNEIKISIDGGELQTVWSFDELPGGKDNKKDVNRLFVSRYTQGNYSQRRIIVDLGYLKQGARSFPVNKGIHTIRVEVLDFVGNLDSKNFEWTVQ